MRPMAMVSTQTLSTPGITSSKNFAHLRGLNMDLFSVEELAAIHRKVHTHPEFAALLNSFSYPQLSNVLQNLISDAVVIHRRHGLDEKAVRNRCENLLDYKERTGCVESIESCMHDGCHTLKISCATRKTKEDILNVLQLFESRKNRSQVAHVALELFFKKVIEASNVIGIVLGDKIGTPKVFTTDGSGLMPIISEGSRRIGDALTEHEFRFSAGESLQVFNQYFPLDSQMAHRLLVIEKNPGLAKYIHRLTFASVGVEIAHERQILSLIYVGDNHLPRILPRVLEGVLRINIETDPEMRLRSGFGKKPDK